MKLGSGAKTSVTIAALAVLSSFLVIGTRHRATTSETDARAKNLLGVWRENELTRIELFSQGRVLLERQSDDSGQNVWRLKEPVSEPADEEAVQRLITELGFAVPAQRTEQAPEALGIGASSPAIDLTMGAIHYRLRLGKAAVRPEGAAYVDVRAEGAPGSGTAVVSRDTAALFRLSLDDLRPRSLWPYGQTALKSLTIESPRGKLELLKGDGASFTLAGGQRANREALAPLFASLSRLTVARFIELKRAEAALAAGQRTLLHAVPQEGAPLSLELGGSCPDQPDLTVVVRRAPQPLAGCTERAVLDSLELGPEALLDTQAFSVHPDEVEELDIEREGRHLVLARKGSEFLLRQPSEAPVALEAGNARLAAIMGASGEIVRAADSARLGLEPAAGHVTVTSAGDGKAFQEVVMLGRKTAEGQLPLKRQDGAVLLLDRDRARAFAVDSTLLRGLRLLEFSGSELRQLTLSAPESQKLARTSAGGFQLLEPKGLQVDGALASDLALALGALSAVRWVADADDGSFGLDKPVARAELEFDAGDAGPRTRTLLLGAAVSGGNYARFNDDPAIFVIEREVLDKLGTLLINRSEFVVDPASVSKVELRHAGKRVVLVERGSRLVPLEPANLPGEQLQAITEALSMLRADAALHSGGARADEGFAAPELEARIERRAGTGPPLLFSIGASDSWRGLTIAYARAEGVNATFVIARSKLRPLLDAF